MQYQDLEVTKTAKDVFRKVVSLKYNTIELDLIKSHLVRTALSIGSNIAEGHGRGSSKEFTRFLAIALGSAKELHYQMSMYEELSSPQPELMDLIDKCCAQLYRLIEVERAKFSAGGGRQSTQ
jgi:four helix bundle protein